MNQRATDMTLVSQLFENGTTKYVHPDKSKAQAVSRYFFSYDGITIVVNTYVLCLYEYV